MLVESYCDYALGKSQCFKWYKSFKSDNFDVRNEEPGRPPKKFKDNKLQNFWEPNATKTHESIKCDTKRNFNIFESYKKYPK